MVSTLDLERLRLLGGVRVFGTLVDLELAVHRAAERVLRQHALDRDLDHAFRVALQRLGEVLRLQVADVTGEPVVHLVLQLLAGHGDLLGIDHDEVIAGVDVGGEHGLVLAAEAACQLGGEAAQGLALGIDDVPVSLDGLVLGAESLHGGSAMGTLSGWLPRQVPAQLHHALWEHKSGNDTGPRSPVQAAGQARMIGPWNAPWPRWTASWPTPRTRWAPSSAPCARNGPILAPASRRWCWTRPGGATPPG